MAQNIQAIWRIYKLKIISRFMLSVTVMTCILISGCTVSEDRLSEGNTDEIQLPILIPLNKDSGYKIHPVSGESFPQDILIAGEKVRTGIPLPAIFVSIDSGVTAPKRILASWSASRLVIPNIIALSGSPLQIPVDESKLKHFVTGVDTSSFVMIGEKGDTIPTGIPLTANGVKSVFRLPKLQDAFPITRNDNAFYDMQLLSTYHGLKSRNINHVMEDSRGLIWISSFDGLTWYDGKQFRHFTTNNGLLNNRVMYAMEDSKGRIWLDHGNGTISCYDGQGFTHYTVVKNKRPLIFLGNNSILEDREGNIWFRNMAHGLSRFDGKSFTHLTEKEGMNSDAVRCMMQDSKGIFWIGTHGKGVSRYDGKTFTWFSKKDGISHNVVSAIVEDRNGVMWFGTDSGLTSYDGRAFNQYYKKDGMSDNIIGSAIMDNQGVLWFGSYSNGLTRYDGRNFSQITERERIPVNRINTMSKDRKGNLWLATERGVLYLQTGNFIRYDMTQAGFSGTLSKIKGISGNRFILGAKGLHLFDFQYLKTLKDGDSLSNKYVTDILEDKKGNTWFGTPQGLFRFDGMYLHQYTTSQGLPHNGISTLLQDSKGRIWVGTQNGICRFDGEKIYQLKVENEPVLNRIIKIFEDTKGDIYIANGKGLSIFDGQNLTQYSKREGLFFELINNIREDRYSNIWFSSNEGICKFNGHDFLYISEKQGLPSKFTGNILEDSLGNFWVNHNKGLSILPSRYIDFCHRFSGNPDLSTDTLPCIINYSISDGIPEFILSSTMENKNKLRIISSETKDVIIELDLKKILDEFEKPVVRIQDLSLFGQSVDFRNLSGNDSQHIRFKRIDPFQNIPVELSLPHNYNQATFFFTADRQAVLNRIMYSYKMVGLNQNWSMPSRDNKAHFQYLPPGNYTFQVKASVDNLNSWSESASFVFKINAPWWQTWWAYTIATLVISSLIILYSRFRSQALRLQNVKLEGKILDRTIQLTNSLRDLKDTQSQLIQSEKMASLGELTAGIAHEIQNPLNFVNNFSEMSNELLTEMKDELDKGDIEEAKIIASNISQNLEKINHHGKRADAIVKGMLQHSRSNTGVKEAANINALSDEYLRLAFQGMRARDRTFNVTLVTDFDENIGQINIIPQDIGRVLLNLYNNSFYAVVEKQKQSIEGYEPTVSVRTKKVNGELEISISDNGNGIPEKVLDKVFQPFFTTKPTGQGTGLGLSLSYDIIKAHQGKISIKNTPGMGAEFIIILPITV